MKNKVHWVVLAGFFLSGAAGLIYEVVWSRLLTLFVGITTYAHTAVITAFMLGLALGSYVIGRRVDRHPSPFRLFAGLEVATGLYAAVTPWLCGWMQGLYVELAKVAGITGLPSHVLRFLMAMLLLLPPTFLMGGTLPVLVRGLARRLTDVQGISSRLYGVNTLGAVLGVIVSGYFLIPHLGMKNALFVGVCLNWLAALAVFLWSRGVALPEPEEGAGRETVTAPDPVGSERRGALRWLPLLFAASGFASMMCQIAWIRALTLVMGASVYAFSATLAVFLTGIALGSILYERIFRSGDDHGRWKHAALLSVVTGIGAVLGLMVIGTLPAAVLWFFQHNWGIKAVNIQLFMFILCFVVMIVPTLCMGAMFPLMTAVWSQRRETIGRDVGVVYSANTAGCIFGTMAAGLAALSVMGVHGTVMTAAGIFVLVGAVYGWLGLSRTSRMLRSTGIGAVLLFFGLMCAFIPSWDKAIMTAGVFNYAASNPGQSAKETLLERKNTRRILYYRDGIDGTVSVMDKDQQRMLVINGKIDASSRGDLPTQIMLGQLPLMMHPNPRKVLVIGLGSGITAGAVAALETVESIDILEISPEVVEASDYFSVENRNVLKDPRVRIVVADARNFLMGSAEQYDVIITEPSNPWITGVANLFTREFFQLMERHLAPGGLVSQWFHMYNMPPADSRMIMKTYQQVFPHTSVWQPMNGDFIMIGSREAHSVDAHRHRDWMAKPALGEQLRLIGKNGLDKIAGMFLIGDESLAVYCHGAPRNTDDRPRIEFSAPFYLHTETSSELLHGVIAHLASFPSAVPISNVARRNGAILELTAINLAVTPSRILADDEWTAFSKVWWQLFSLGDHKPDAVGVGSQTWLSWSDGDTQNHLKSFRQERELTMQGYTEYLQGELRDPALAGGEVEVSGGARGAWLLTQNDATNVTYTITWAVPDDQGGFLQYVASRNQSDPGFQGWGPALVNFARSFSPLYK